MSDTLLKTNQYCRFYLVRHGETEWNTLGKMQGHQDSPLTENGVEQARQLSQMLKNVSFKDAFSSDLLRAQRTAEIVAADHQLVVQTTKLLREMSFGKYEGRKVDEFREELKDLILYRDGLSDEEKFTYRMLPDFETYEEMVARLITFLRQTALAYPGENILVVSHSAMIRILLIHLGWASHESLPHGGVKNTGYVVIESDGIDFFVKETVGVRKSE